MAAIASSAAPSGLLARIRQRGAACCAGVLAVLAVVAAAGQPVRNPRTTPELCIDIARGFALDHRADYTAADIQTVRSWLEAALQLEPSRTDAAVLLFELQSLSGDAEGAAATLEAIARRDPSNEMAFARWVESKLGAMQTNEARQAWLDGLLASGRPPNCLALVHCRLAELSLERLDRAGAEKHVATARALAPDFPPAAELAVRLIPPDAPPTRRVALALNNLRTHPGNYDAAWTVGDALQAVGYFGDAGVFYAHAQRLEAARVGVLSASRFFRLSLNALGRGALGDAIAFAQAALIDGHGGFEAALYLAWLFERAGGDVRLPSLQRRMASDAAQIVDPEQWRPDVVAEVAWYYCTYDVQPQRALMLAESARKRLPSDRFTIRVYAYALAQNGRTDEALPRLKSLADEDPFAAAKYAELLRAAGRGDEADALLAGLHGVPLVGPAAEALRRAGYRIATPEQPSAALLAAPQPAPPPEPAAQLAAQPASEPARLLEPTSAPGSAPDSTRDSARGSAPATAPSESPDLPPAATLPASTQPSALGDVEAAFLRDAAPREPVATAPAAQEHFDPLKQYPEVAELVRSFDMRLFEFDRDPKRLVQVSLAFDRGALVAAEPWRATITLKNDSAFPITLGPDGLINPLALLSFKTEGNRSLELPNLMQVALDRWRWLGPGAKVSVQQTLDVGPLARISDRTPQESLRVVVSGILDPVMTEKGVWLPGPCGQTIEPVAIVRLPVDTSGPALHALFSAISGGSDSERVAALETLCLLLAESQQAKLGRLNYTPQAIPEERIAQVIRSMLLSDSWELRVRVMAALQGAGIDAPTAELVKRNLTHGHWLVRMMAFRLLARQGKEFLGAAEAFVRTEPDPIVRRFAASVVSRWTPPASQPAR